MFMCRKDRGVAVTELGKYGEGRSGAKLLLLLLLHMRVGVRMH